MRKFLLLLLGLQCSLYNTGLAQQPGDLDYGFGSGGLVNMPNVRWFDVAVQADSKLVVVGKVVARYNIDGTLDNAFGINGIDTMEVNNIMCTGNAVGIQPDGKIVVAGGGTGDFLLERYNTDGSLDSSFDGDGVVLTDVTPGFNDHVYALAIQPDGKIIVAGESNTVLALSRYHPNGTLDVAFDSDGILLINSINVDGSFFPDPAYMKLQTDGKILVGSADRLVRLNSDGSFDNSFGTNGLVMVVGHSSDIAIQPDGKLLVAGGGGAVRLNPNGGIDSAFGMWGSVISNGSAGDEIRSIALQPDGRIILAGFWKSGLTYRYFLVARYSQDGHPDLSFGGNGGVVTVDGFDGSAYSYASVITPDMKIVLAGYEGLGPSSGFLAKYHLGFIGWPVEANAVSGSNKNFVIAPNPSFDWIDIEAAEVEIGVWHLELRDITGRLMQQEDMMITGGSIQKKVSLSNLSAGLYILQLDNGKTKMMSRLVKVDK